MPGWFSSLGWWKQDEAYADFERYRSNPTPENLDIAIESAIPVIRVVFSSQKVKITRSGDEEDLISSAALTIVKALPKMAKKPTTSIGNNSQYLRYLYTCCINAFYREIEVLYGKHNKLNKKLNDSSRAVLIKTKLPAVEAKMVLAKLPGFLFAKASENCRFVGTRKQICEYILQQMLYGREISKSVLSILGCEDQKFYIQYCLHLLIVALRQTRSNGLNFCITEEEISYLENQKNYPEIEDEEADKEIIYDLFNDESCDTLVQFEEDCDNYEE
jgi:hypothetical protein